MLETNIFKKDSLKNPFAKSMGAKGSVAICSKTPIRYIKIIGYELR